MNKAISLHGLFILLIASLFYSYEFIHRLSPGAMIPELMAAYDVSASQLGTLSAMYFYSYGLFQIPAGIIVDRYPLRYIVFVASICIAFGSLIQAYSFDYFSVCLARGFIGAGSAFGFVSCVKIGTTWFHEHRLPLIIGITNLFGVMGAFIGGAPLVSAINTFGWQKVYVISAGIGVLLSVLSILFLKVGPYINESVKEKCSKTSIRHLLGSKYTWVITFYAALSVSPITAFAELWSLPFFENVYHLSRNMASYANSFIFFGIAIGGPTIGWLSTKLPSPTRLQMSTFSLLALLALLSILLGYLGNQFTLFLILFLYGFFTSNMLLSFSLVTKLNSYDCTGLVIGFTNTVIMVCGAILQPAIGSMIDMYATRADLAPGDGIESAIQLSLLPLCLCLILATIIPLAFRIPSINSSVENR